MKALLLLPLFAAVPQYSCPPAPAREGPLASGCFMIKVDGAKRAQRACLGDRQGEMVIRVHLEQESYGNTETGITGR